MNEQGRSGTLLTMDLSLYSAHLPSSSYKETNFVLLNFVQVNFLTQKIFQEFQINLYLFDMKRVFQNTPN